MRFPERERGVDVAIVRTVLDLRVFAILLECCRDGDVPGRALIPRSIVDLRLFRGPQPDGLALAAHALAKARAVGIADLNEPAILLGTPDWPFREVAILSFFHVQSLV